MSLPQLEYKTLPVSFRQLEASLNAAASRGWKLAAITPLLDLGSSDGFLVILERGGDS